RNVISGNTLDGVHVQGSTALPATSNVIQGNFIGVGANGHSSIGTRTGGTNPGTASGNFVYGVELSGATSTTVGGTAPGAGNVIGFNLDGVEITNGSQNNLVQGNLIGIGADSTATVGNILHGVAIRSSGALSAPFGPGQANEPGSQNNTIGGTAAGAGNLIA